MCGSTRELGPDGICLDADACIADLDALLAIHTCPRCVDGSRNPLFKKAHDSE